MSDAQFQLLVKLLNELIEAVKNLPVSTHYTYVSAPPKDDGGIKWTTLADADAKHG